MVTETLLNVDCSIKTYTTLKTPEGFNRSDYIFWYSWEQEKLCNKIAYEDEFSLIMVKLLFGETSFCLNLWLFYLIQENKRLGAPIKAHLLNDILLRCILAFGQVYFGSCLIKDHCLGVVGYPMSGAMINQLVSALYLSTRISTQWHEHMITANRLLSVSFNGTYSHFLSKWIWLQLVVIIFVPLMPYAPTIGSVTLVFANIWIPAGFIYNVNSHLFQRKSSGFILDPLINYLSDITPLLCLMMLVLDIITLHNSHGRTKTSSLDIQQQRMDTRVSIQMLTLHLTNILYWIVNLIVNFQLASANFQYLLTIFSGTQYLIQGMLMTYFNWPIKGKGKFARVFTTKTA